MLKKIPIVAAPITMTALLEAWKATGKKRKPRKEWEQCLSLFLGKERVFCLNSGSASLFVILRALRKRSAAGEVILPAYCADALVIAVQKAGLKPILCDINLDDFSLDIKRLENCIGTNTLCVVGAHMFGIVASGLKEWKKRHPEIPLIEDCAQALGSKYAGSSVGNMGEASFFSFNRGKNLPTYGGGCIASSNNGLIGEIAKEMEALREAPLSFKLSIPWKIILLSLLVKPRWYAIAYPLLRQYKEQATPRDFPLTKYTALQAAVARQLLKRIDEFSKARYNNGSRLIKGLSNTRGILLPKIAAESEPAFNRLPVLFEDLAVREKVEKALARAGIETSRMYQRPLHHAFDLVYEKTDFPNAVYLAEHHLTLPAHPLAGDKAIEEIIRIIRNTTGA